MSVSAGVNVADVAPAMFAHPEVLLRDRAHCQLMPVGPSSSSSDAVTGTRAWIVAVSEVSVTVPGSSTFRTVMVTSCVSSMVVDVAPVPSLPSWTSTVTL